MRRKTLVWVFVTMTILSIGWFARVRTAPPDLVLPATGASPVAPHAPAVSRVRLSTPNAATAPATAPLPYENAPLVSVYDELAARAKAGDNVAAMRLAFDLNRCARRDWDLTPEQVANERVFLTASLRGVDRESAEQKLALCVGIDAARVAARGEWVLLAAEHGDAEAMVCYAAMPNDLGPKFLSDEWFDWSQTWRARAPGFAERAFELGRADILAMLADALHESTIYGERYSFWSVGLLLSPDPARSAAYTEMVRRLTLGDVRSVSAVNGYGKTLSEADRERAQAILDRDWPRFADTPVAQTNSLPCRRLAASMR